MKIKSKLNNHPKTKLLIILSSIALLFIISCKKEIDKTDKIKGNELTSLRNWFKTNTLNITPNRFSTMTPNWQAVYVNEQVEQTIYEVPLANPQHVFQASNILIKGNEVNFENKNNIKLLIIKNKKTNAIAYGAYMSIIGDDESSELKTLHYKAKTNLTGKILFFNIDGTFSNGWYYNKGIVANQISASTDRAYINSKFDALASKNINTALQREKLQKESANPCLTGIPDYGISCAGVPGYMNCTYYITGYTYIDLCGGGGGEIGDTGSYYPTPIAGQPQNGGGGGGNPNNPPTMEIKQDSLQKRYPCLVKEVLDKLLANATYGKLNTTISKC